MKSIALKKLSLYLSLALLFCSLPVVHVSAAVIPSIDDVSAVWDSNIPTEWNVVYNEYKSLNPSTRYEADKVIAANAYRFLISIGSKPLEQISQQSFDDFLRAVSPFNIAYNNVIAESVVHAAWSISSEQYRVFCANVIHNLAQGSDYYQTHVIKNDDFINGAGQGSLQIQYNDVDYNEEINIYNNIFNGNVLGVSGSAVEPSYIFNPLIFGYDGPNITLDGLNVYRSLYSDVYNVVYNTSNGYSGSSPIPSNELGLSYTDTDLYLNLPNFNKAFVIFATVNYYSSGSFGLSFQTKISSYPREIDLRYLVNPVNSYFYTSSILYFQNTYISRDLLEVYSLDEIIQSKCSDFFRDYVFDHIAFVSKPIICVRKNSFPGVTNGYAYTIPFKYGNFYFISPQFQPVNIYNNNYYGSDDDTYFHVDQMVDNIINNDYSTVNNGTNNSFYIDNYYVPETVSNGAIQLVTSSSITYNYITIINNNGSSSGGSIGTGPFDVRVINPEDFSTETIVNNNKDILNNYNFDFGDLNINNTVGTGIDNARDNLSHVVTTSSINVINGFVSGIPSDWKIAIFAFMALGFIVLVINKVIGK